MKRMVAPFWNRLPKIIRKRLVRMSQGTFTVGVSAVVVNRAGEVLLLRHRFRDNVGWELPGGFVSHGEQLDKAIVRELEEETGLEVEIVSLLSVTSPRAEHIDVCFSARPVQGTLQVEGGEILEGRFFGAGSLPRELMAEHRRNIEIALEESGRAVSGER